MKGNRLILNLSSQQAEIAVLSKNQQVESLEILVSGISKGICFQPSFFLTNFISSSPKGLPWDDALPPLLGDPYPIVVLQDIANGFFEFWAFFNALKICFSLCPFISK